MICVPDDNFYDDRAEMDVDTISDLEEDRILNTIIKFKDFMVKEPEFYGINNLSSFKILKIIQPDPVPISKMYKFLFLKILITLSQSNSVSGLGINVFLSTKKFLLQNSLFFKIYANGSLLALLLINFSKSRTVLSETF